MKMNFDLKSVILTEFGIGRDNQSDSPFTAIPVDNAVQMVLRDMAQATDVMMRENTTKPALYEPSEKYESSEYLYLPLADELAAEIKFLHEAINLDIDANALLDHKNIFCYFARFKDMQGRSLTAFRKATYFKGILKGRLIHIFDDSLKFVEDNIFKLDNDFDFLVDSENIYILKPSSFEFAGKLKNAILAAVSKNIKIIKEKLPFVDFENIAAYAEKHSRAARYLASIIMKEETTNIDKDLLLNYCQDMKVVVTKKRGRLIINSGSEMDFLEVLDRRRFGVELIRGQQEKFRAGSRTQLN
jgi:hypothetical protein